jgi:hypothetical protein
MFSRRFANRYFRPVKINEDGPRTPFLHSFPRTAKKPHSLLLAQAKPRNMISDMNDKKRYVNVLASLINISSNISHQEYICYSEA